MKREVAEELQRRKRNKRKVNSNQKGEERIIFNRAVDMRRKVAGMKQVSKKKNQIVQENAAGTQKRLLNGKRYVQEPERRKNKNKRRSSTKKRTKSKKQKTRERRKNLKSGKQENGQVRVKGKKGKKTNRLKGRERQGEVNVTACLMKVMFYARLNEKKASAISRQVKRIKDNKKIQLSKGKKKSEFNGVKDRLLSALGGDALNPTCAGQSFNSTISNSTRNRAFSQNTLSTLMGCEADIEEKCGDQTTWDTSKLEELEECETLALNFKDALSECFAPSMNMEEGCICVQAIRESDVVSMQKCDAKAENNAALNAKKLCKKAVGECKNAAVAAVEGIDTCKEEKYSQATAAASTAGQIGVFFY